MKPTNLTTQSDSTLSTEQYRQARLARDPRFDGRFFVGVHSTQIYCRNICRVKPPLEKNVRYYSTAAAAEQAGLRPCLRCRPELAPSGNDLRSHQPRLWRALTLLQADGDASVADLARRCHVSERQLRRLFQQHLGVSPTQALQTQRLLLAKQLLTDTSLPVTEVAFACGYHSVRRFNDAFVNHYRLTPSRFRQTTEDAKASSLTLRLSYRKPYDFQQMLSFYRARAIDGLEWVEQNRFFKRLSADSMIEVSDGGEALVITLTGCSAAQLPEFVTRLRQMWDLDADPSIIKAALSEQPQLARLIERYDGVRVAAYWNGWEALLRAILGQQVTIEAGRKLLCRLVELNQDSGGFGLPTPAQLAQLDLSELGMPNSRKQTLHRVAVAASDWALTQWPDIDEIATKLAAIKGIGPWTVAYWRLRSGGDPDSLPSGDVVLRKAASQQQMAEDQKMLEHVAEAWRPWRSYATALLWLSTME